MMIKKIISGGQTGADRAALDVAIRFSIPHGGWIPKGRKTENGPLPDKYQLKELPTASYAKRTEQNVLDSDATLIISQGKLTGGSDYTRKMAIQHNRPWLHIDLNKTNGFEAAKTIDSWIVRHKIETLNVAGTEASKDPGIYQATVDLIKTIFYLTLIETTMPGDSYASPSLDQLMGTARLPKTVDQAVEQLIYELALKDKASIAKMKKEDLASLQPTVGSYIKNAFQLWSGNISLMESCLSASGESEVNEDDASGLIIKALWKQLRETYRMRLIK
jgi:hypothetical protein